MGKTLMSAVAVARGTSTAALRAVDYLRVSTQEQKRGYGIAYTGKKTRRHIDKKGWAYVKTYADEGYSGSLDHTQRPDLRELMQDAQQTPRPFDVVTVAEERAIGRRDRAFWPWVWKLEDLGIYVAVVRGDYDNTTEHGRSKMRKEADRAEDERITIRDRTQGGVQEKAEFGGHPGGVAPYGYRIKYKGVKGESVLELDQGEEDRAYEVLHRAWELIVIGLKSPYEVEDIFNTDGVPGPNGDHWPRGSLRKILTGRAVQKSNRIFRDPEGSKTRLGDDGFPLFGDTVPIELEPVFTPPELERLNKALERTARGPRTDHEEVHPLSKHVFGQCGRHYTGTRTSGRAAKPVYRCSGSVRKAGRQKCTCSQIDAALLETWVWSEICRMLEDPERLRRMAEDWNEMACANTMDYEKHIEKLNTQIEELDATIDVAMSAASRQAVRNNLRGREAGDYVDAAVHSLNEDREKQVKLRDEALAWQKASEETVERAIGLEKLARMARLHMYTMDTAQQAEVVHLLDLKVTILGEIPRRTRSDDQISAWFNERDRVVPALTDDAWKLVESILAATPGRKPKAPRALLGAMLDKARTGCAWNKLPYGNVASVWSRWLRNGLWERLLTALESVPGTPAYQDVLLPELRVEGCVDPRLMVGEDKKPEDPDPFKASDYKISPFELESALLEHEAVAEAAVVPSPDPVRLAVPKAYVVLAGGWEPGADTAKALFAHSRETLAPYKRVRVIEFANLPKTISGKIRRVELRAHAAGQPGQEYREER
ncbi:recombinase family protein [Streptomyces ovatisporus]|uniref:Recombinase family protein n=1 Tax=Streptomyces ovatisporus TaxID=1128682 RepID=A0ABV9AAI9_9ACTN